MGNRSRAYTATALEEMAGVGRPLLSTFPVWRELYLPEIARGSAFSTAEKTGHIEIREDGQRSALQARESPSASLHEGSTDLAKPRSESMILRAWRSV